MNISPSPCSKIKRYLTYNQDNSLQGSLDVVKSSYTNAYYVIKANLSLQSNLSWSSSPYPFSSEKDAMLAISLTSIP